MKKFLSVILLTLFLTNNFSELSYSKNTSWAENKLKGMTLREKIAQMIVTNSDGFYLNENDKEFKRLENLITKEKIGGVIFFKGKALDEARLINKLQSLSETPLLISQDFERGTAMRLDDGSLFPNNMAIGATRNPELAYKMGLQIAKECRALGIHQNYSPVVDVNNNSKNPIINVRSFGEDPQLVSDMGNAMIKGLQDGGVIATAKHFPGHGDTDIDTHNDLPVINHNMERLNRIELVPFVNAIKTGVKSVMIAHLSFPSVDKTPFLPASLSPEIVNGLLIDKLGFNGLVVTDALNMSAITKHFSTEEVALSCINAGIDLILMPQGETKTIDAIEKAVKKEQFSEERINKSVTKILEAKEWLKLNENKLVDENKVLNIVNNDKAQELSQELADASITLVKNDNILPFTKNNRDKKILMLPMFDGTEPDMLQNFYDEFSNKTSGLFSNPFEIKTINGNISDFDKMFEIINDYDYYVIPLFIKVKMKTGTVGMNQSQADFIDYIIHKSKKVIVISFGNPYLLQNFREVPVYIAAYGDSPATIKAVAKSLTGEIKPKGKLPVSIDEEFKFGLGLTY